jgi:hypothetical protein
LAIVVGLVEAQSVVSVTSLDEALEAIKLFGTPEHRNVFKTKSISTLDLVGAPVVDGGNFAGFEVLER